MTIEELIREERGRRARLATIVANLLAAEYDNVLVDPDDDTVVLIEFDSETLALAVQQA